MTPPRVLLLVPTRSYRAGDFLEAARRMGVAVTVASEEPSTLERSEPGTLLTLPMRDPAAAARAAREFARDHPLAAVVAVDDGTTLAGAAIAAALGLEGNPPEAVRAARDKRLMRERLRTCGVRQPRFVSVALGADSKRAADEVPFPCVLKPLHLAASRGVIRADDAAEFARAFERLRALLARSEVVAESGPSTEILVEEFVPGWEVAVEGLLRNGAWQPLCIFDKPEPLDGPYFPESIYVTPPRKPVDLCRQIAEFAGEAALGLGLREGPVHVELRGNDAGLWLIEVAARSIGGLCSRALRFGAGLSLEELILEHALGREPARIEREGNAAGVAMLHAARNGRFRATRGLARARAVEGIREVTITVHPGQVLEAHPEGALYVGFIVAKAPAPDLVEAALRAARDCLEVDMG